MANKTVLWRMSLLILICVGFFGCAGGGTTGTGGGSVQVSGSLRSGQTPLSGVRVVGKGAPVNKASPNSNTNEADTDAKGNFTLFVDVSTGETIELDFTADGIDSSYKFSALPNRTAIVRVDLEYDDESGEVSENSVKYEDENGNDVD